MVSVHPFRSLYALVAIITAAKTPRNVGPTFKRLFAGDLGYACTFFHKGK